MRFVNFLKSDDRILKKTHNLYQNNRGSYEVHYVKVDSDHPDITYLYYRDFQRSFSNPFDKLTFLGIYSHKLNLFVCLYEIHLHEIDFTGLKVISLREYEEKITEEIRKEISRLLPLDNTALEIVNLEDYQIENAHREAYELYLLNKPINRMSYTELYKVELKYEDYPILFQYLAGNTNVITAVAKKFIEDEKNNLLKRMKYTQIISDELERLNQTNEHLEKRNIFEVLDPTMKTVNIKVKRDGKEMSLKVKNDFSVKYDYISLYSIVQRSKRDKYEELFGRYSDVRLDDIVEVSYGRKTLYKRTDEVV